jgi:hypothetical protein
LYRALRRECSRFPVAVTTGGLNDADGGGGSREILESLVRYRFEHDRKLQSPSQIANGIEAGQGFLDLLRACNRSQSSAEALGSLSRILESTTRQAEDTAALRARFASFWKPPPPERARHLENIARVRNKANYVSSTSSSATPSEPPRIFQHPRPLSEVKSGVRKVPNLLVTQGIPLLKYPGPQPVLLNRVLKSKTEWGIKMWQKHKHMEEGAHLAECEDEWDEILRREHGIVDEEEAAGGGGGGGEASDGHGHHAPSDYFVPFGQQQSLSSSSVKQSNTSDTWAGTFRAADKELEGQVLARGRKHADLGRKLWQVVLAERELKEKERKEARYLRRMARRNLSEPGEGQGEGGATNAA